MKSFLNVCLILLCATSILAQSNEGKDPVSGVWGDPDGPGFDLKFDGKHGVSGTIRIVNDAGKSTAVIKTGTFDMATGALKLEGDATGPDGVEAPFVIEGKIAEDKVTGKYRFAENAQGEFTFARVKKLYSSATPSEPAMPA